MDARSKFIESDSVTEPINIRIEQKILAWEQDTLADFQVLEYRIINNRSNITGYILNVQMSALFLVEIVNRPTQRAYSMGVGVTKMFGTLVILLAELVAASPSLFVLVLGPITLALDLAYVALIAQRERLAVAVHGAAAGPPTWATEARVR